MSDRDHYAIDGKCSTCHTSAPCLVIAEQAASEWRDLANLWETLHAYLEPHRSGESTGRTPPTSRPPISLIASDVLRELDDWAWFYASALMDETTEYTPANTTPERLRDIAERHGHFTAGEDERWVKHHRRDPDMPPGHWQRVALDYCDTAHEMRRKVLGVIERPPPPKFMGPCMAEGGCGGDVYLRHGEKIARCVECDQGHDDADLRRQMWRALEARLIRRDELREALNMLRPHGTKRVSPELVRKWIQRGRLVPVIRDPELFRLTDAADVAGFDLTAQWAP